MTFNGPGLMTDLAEFPRPFPYTERWFLRAMTKRSPIGSMEPASQWTEERLEWSDKSDRTRPRQLVSSGGWTWLKDGFGQGCLWRVV